MFHSKSMPAIKMILSMSIFGSIGFFSVQTGLPSFELVFVRCICATIFLALCWLVTGQYKSEQWNKKEVMQILACGVFLVFNWVFLFKAFEVMSITIAISVYHLAPIIVLMIGSIVFKERLTMFAVLSIVICFIGTVLVAGVDGSLSLEKLMSSGMVWALLAALFYAFTTLLGKRNSAYERLCDDIFTNIFRYIFIATIRRLWQVSRVNRDELDDDYSDRSYTYGICILLIF